MNSRLAWTLLKLRRMTKSAVLLSVVLWACADLPEVAPDEAHDEQLLATAALESARADARVSELPFAPALEACYAALSELEAPPEVHSTGRYLALGDRVLVVQVAIPQAPELARCIEDAVRTSVPPGWQHAADRLACGSFAIDLGGPAPAVEPADIERQFREHERGMAELMQKTVALGVLPADHPLVRELSASEGE